MSSKSHAPPLGFAVFQFVSLSEDATLFCFYPSPQLSKMDRGSPFLKSSNKMPNLGFSRPRWFSGKESACNAGATGDTGSIPGSERSPGERQGNPLQYSCLKNPMDRETWWAMAHRAAKSQTLLKRLGMHAHINLARVTSPIQDTEVEAIEYAVGQAEGTCSPWR